MAQQVRLFLVRHGETVDNVAQLYAGSRDSELTNHGYQQATRLGLHFKSLGLVFTHLFSSHLQRAAKTAGLIREAQITPSAGADVNEVPDVIQLPILMEQDFGYYEGKKWYERPADSKLSGKDHHRREHEDTTGFVDVESKDSMARRVDTFLDEHLLPILETTVESVDHVVAVVSHGIILSVLWKRLLSRLPPKSVSFSPDLFASSRGYSLEHLGGWSNTGYLELHMQRIILQEPALAGTVVPSTSAPASAGNVGRQAQPASGLDTVSEGNLSDAVVPQPGVPTSRVEALEPSSHKLVHGWLTMIETVNGRDHLQGLKRTRGGVGSARHDASQKNIDSFFKRRKND